MKPGDIDVEKLAERCQVSEGGGAYNNLWKEAWREANMIQRNWINGRCELKDFCVANTRDSITWYGMSRVFRSENL